MGEDKSRLVVDGRTLAESILIEFDRIDVPVTVLGREALPGRAFLKDDLEHLGPARALSRFVPGAKMVFVCSCDIPRFRAECVPPIISALGSRDAAIPVIGGREQYLCAAYSARVFREWRRLVDNSNTDSMRDLVRVLDCEFIDELQFESMGISPEWLIGVNTREELQQATENAGGKLPNDEQKV